MNKKKTRDKKSFEFLLLFLRFSIFITQLFSQDRAKDEKISQRRSETCEEKNEPQKYTDEGRRKKRSSREFKFSSCLPLFLLPPPSVRLITYSLFFFFPIISSLFTLQLPTTLQCRFLLHSKLKSKGKFLCHSQKIDEEMSEERAEALLRVRGTKSSSSSWKMRGAS